MLGAWPWWPRPAAGSWRCSRRSASPADGWSPSSAGRRACRWSSGRWWALGHRHRRGALGSVGSRHRRRL